MDQALAVYTFFEFKQSRPTSAIESLMAGLTRIAHIEPSGIEARTISLGHRSIHVHALTTRTALYSPADQIHVGLATAALNGYVFDPASAATRPLTAGDLASRFSIFDCDTLAGEYSLAHLSATGTLTALSDLHRIQSVYYVDTPEVFAISTRPSLAALVAESSKLNLNGIAALTTVGYGLGEETLYSGVRAVPQGTALQWDGARARIVERDRVIQAPSSDGISLDDAWTQEQVEAGIRAAARTIELATKDKETIDLGITGGKDSRLTLAFCMAEGLTHRLRLFTRGTPDHPDVVVGQLIADAIGVPHRIVTPPAAPGTAPVFTAEGYFDRIDRSAFQADGLAGAWDPFAQPRTGTTIAMSGLMGEVLKAYAKTPYTPAEKPSAPEIVRLQGLWDPMGVVEPGVANSLASRLEDRFSALLDHGFTQDDLPDIYYYENRIPNWLGSSYQVHTFSQTGVLPLGAVPLARLAFRATAEQRKRELIHYLILRTAAPQLIDIPFALQSWHPSLPVSSVQPVPLPTSNPAVRMHGSWQYSANQPDVRAAIIERVRDSAAPAFFSTIDRRKLLERLDGPALAMKEIISLLGALTALACEAGTANPQKLSNAEATVPTDLHGQ